MQWNDDLVRLKSEFMRLYPTKVDSYPIVREAGLRFESIAFQDMASNNWSEIIEAALREEKVFALLHTALRYYPENKTLQNIERSLETVSSSSHNSPFHIHRRILGFLPSVRTPIGRDNLLLQMKQQLRGQHGAFPFVVLHGQAGMGKTTIASCLAYDKEIHANFPGGVLWANLGKDPSVDDILAVWDSQLDANIARVTPIQEKIGCIQQKLGQASFLLIIDDLWRFDRLSAIDHLLSMVGPTCATLVTTRERTIADDLCRRVGGVSISVNELDEEAALTLIKEICQEKLSDQGMLVSLTKVAGGLPLTLELMGAYISHNYPVADNPLKMLQDLRENYQHLPGDAGPRGLPLKGVINLSVKDLPDRRTKKAFFALGAFAPKPATFSEEALQFVTGADPNVLQNLYGRHLLERNSSGRYTIHQSISSVARGRLSRNDPAWRHHRKYYQEQIKQKVMLVRGEHISRNTIDWRTLFFDLPQIRAMRMPPHQNAAFSILVNRLAGSIPWVRRLDTLPLWLKSGISSMVMVGLALLEKGAHVIRKKHMEAVLANYQGLLYAEAGARDRALYHYEHAYNLWFHKRNYFRLADVLDNFGKICYMQADYRRAIWYYHQALKNHRMSDDPGGRAHIYMNIGAALDMVNRTNWAIKSLHIALSLYRRVKDERGEAFTLLILGTCYHGLGQREHMLASLEQALTKQTSAEDNSGRARTLMELGLVYLDFDTAPEQEQEGNSLETAMQYFQQALALQQQFGDLAWQGRTYSRIGQVYEKKHEIDKALNAYLQALSLHEQVGYKEGISATLGFISHLFHEAGQDIWTEDSRDRWEEKG